MQFGKEIEPAIQNHLDGGCSVQLYVQQAVKFFTKALEITKDDKYKFGYGDKSRFGTYNTEMNPQKFLAEEEEV